MAAATTSPTSTVLRESQVPDNSRRSSTYQATTPSDHRSPIGIAASSASTYGTLSPSPAVLRRTPLFLSQGRHLQLTHRHRHTVAGPASSALARHGATVPAPSLHTARVGG